MPCLVKKKQKKLPWTSCCAQQTSNKKDYAKRKFRCSVDMFSSVVFLKAPVVFFSLATIKKVFACEQKRLSCLNASTSALTRPKCFSPEAKTWRGLIPGGQLHCVIVLSHRPQLGCDRCLLGMLQDRIVNIILDSFYYYFCLLVVPLTFCVLVFVVCVQIG